MAVLHLKFKNIKTESTKAHDLGDELGSQNKSPGAEKGENQLAATVLSRWGRVKTEETIGSKPHLALNLFLRRLINKSYI